MAISRVDHMTTANRPYAAHSNQELRRLESDRATAPDVWRDVVAEIAAREKGGVVAKPTAAKPAYDDSVSTMRVVLTGIDVPFWDLVRILFKLAIAAVPAMLLVFAFWFFVVVGLGGVVRGFRP